MGDTENLCSRRREDGSVDAWLDGWHVHFPVDEDVEPTCKRAAAPMPSPGDVDGVTAGTFGDSVAVRYRRWIVMLDGLRARVERIVPRRPVDTRLYFKFRSRP